jgi:hypothetical protein
MAKNNFLICEWKYFFQLEKDLQYKAITKNWIILGWDYSILVRKVHIFIEKVKLTTTTKFFIKKQLKRKIS